MPTAALFNLACPDHGGSRQPNVEANGRPAVDFPALHGKKNAPRLFQLPLTLRDPAGAEWPVVYEAIASHGQFHRRFSLGWSDFCRGAGVELNDVVEFQRDPGTHVQALRVRVIKRRRGRL